MGAFGLNNMREAYLELLDLLGGERVAGGNFREHLA